ncbi:hypothetical protein [Natronorubrum texcoconense]|uniref:hypothetical protein n=1 Tax=Natronorubrum texcoconense TaxID=1095776 RepID=UPI00111445C4|nr:hypothetical protein [Natronorubrum texcoconense]
MRTNRRTLLTAYGGSLAALSGCARLTDSSEFRVEVEFNNTSDRERTFHFAFESSDGVEDWITHTLDGGEVETLSRELASDHEWGFHGVSDDEVLSGELRGVESGVCIQLRFVPELNGSDTAQIHQGSDDSC